MKHALVILAALILLRIADPWPIETLRLKFFDSLFALDDPVPSETIAIYNIDENALADKGQWPWPRSYLADLNNELLNKGAAAVVYTALFPEEDRFGGDAAFAQSMAGLPTFLSAVATTDTSRKDGWHIGVSTIGPVLENAPEYSGILPNVPLLQSAAVGTGIVNSALEIDGLVRRVPMLVRVGDSLYPALGLDVLRGLAGDPSYQAKAGDAGIQAVRVPQFSTINTDHLGRVWLKWNTTFSNDVESKIVLVGVTAAGVSPMVSTPIGLMHPHRIQAALFETLMQGTSPTRPDWSLAAEIALILVIGVVVAALTKYIAVMWVSALVLISGAATASASVYAYTRYGLLLDAAFPLLTLFSVGATGIAREWLRNIG